MVEPVVRICVTTLRQLARPLDTSDAMHEAGDLLQASLEVKGFKTLRDVIQVRDPRAPSGARPIQELRLGRMGFGCRQSGAQIQ